MPILGAAAAPASLPADPAARRPPVVLVVFDEFPTTSLLGPGRRIDAGRYPNFAALARDATWFRNATSVADSTIAAIPAILDGRSPTRALPPTATGHPRNLFTLLSARGYRVKGSEEATRICPVRWCGHHHPTRYYLVGGRLLRFERFIASIEPTRRPTFYFKHTLLPHLPWISLPSGRHYLHGVRGTIPGINGQRGVDDPDLVHLAYQRHLLQVGAVDRELGRLLSRLRETGLYDRALVIVAADHGISFLVGQRDRRVVRRFNVQDIAPVPLFVKRPGQRHGRISRAYARTYDILPTIADVLHVRVPWRTAGRSVFSSALRRRRTIRLVGRNRFERVVRLSTADFQGRWRGAIRRRQLLFGSGLARPGLYRVGPRADLIGRRTEGLPIAPPGAPHALVNGAAELRHVDLGSDYRPVLVSGRIGNGAPRARRDIAIAINGRIEAVTRSFYLRGSHKESFACLVPEDALLATNRVQVLAVSGERRGLRLQLLGAV